MAVSARTVALAAVLVAAAAVLAASAAAATDDDHAWTRARWGTPPYKLPLPAAVVEGGLPPSPTR